MRVLVAGRNAKVLAKAAGTFVHDLEIHTAGTKAACFNLLQRAEFDLIVACETLSDGSGLEVLSHVAVNTPNTLRIFAARPTTLLMLKGELGLFGLFRTLPYPINFQKLWAAINLARSTCIDPAVVERAPASRVQPAVIEETWDGSAEVEVAVLAVARKPQKPALTATNMRAPQRQSALAPANVPARQQPAATSAAARVTRTPARPQPQQPAFSDVRVTATTARGRQQPAAANNAARATPTPTRGQPQPAQRQQEITSGMRAAARYAAAQSKRETAAKSTRIPESDAFKRARARRDSGRIEPVVSSESLAQLAKQALTSRPAHQYRSAPAGKKRAAWYVGSGVFAATTAAILTFFMVNANNSIKQPKLPTMASITQPVSNKVFPWQPETQEPVRQAAFMRSEAPASAVADIQAEAEAASETADGDPDHPGPPPSYSPPPPSEPPSLESQGLPVDE